MTEPQKCDVERLKKFLNQQLNEAELVELETHLTSCTFCQKELERLAVGDYADDFDDLRANQTNDDTKLVSPSSNEVAETIEAVAKIARFTIHEKVGAGSFGQVYRARDEELDRFVALKVVRPEALVSPNGVEAYLAEARLHAQLRHEAIVQVFDAGRTEEVCYVVFEYLSGGTLRDSLRVRWDFDQIAEAVLRLARALHHIHQKGLQHRDVKPTNILLDDEGKVYLCDFGLAKRVDQFNEGLAGTPSYMSPEQARGELHRADHRSDIFSLGVVLYEMLTGKRLFSSGSSTKTLEMIAHFAPTSIRAHHREVPPELDRICCKMLASLASERYQSAQELAEDLELWLTLMRRPDFQLGPDETELAAPPRQLQSRGLRPFKREYAEAYLELVPGPRDAVGMPQLIRFWLDAIEGKPNRSEAPLDIGILHGPSGAGKSSLLEAGILARLAPHVRTAKIECGTGSIESTTRRVVQELLQFSQKAGMTKHLSLGELFAMVRDDPSHVGASRQLLVFDQFERWLDRWNGNADDPMIAALRQCDGKRLLALLVIRAEYWGEVSRLMEVLERPLHEGTNSKNVIPFDRNHAKLVIARFAAASNKESQQLDAFSDELLNQLAARDFLWPAQLTLSLELIGDMPWTRETLTKLGGVDGLYRTWFENFFGPTAPAWRHKFQSAIIGMLARMFAGLESGRKLADLAVSRSDLQTASGIAHRPTDFATAIDLLENELRLISVVDNPDANEQHYRILHDVLVKPIQLWIEQATGQTWRGRARQRLANLARSYEVKPEQRYLPSFGEWLRMRAAGTQDLAYRPEESKLLGLANRFYSRATIGMTALVALLGWNAWEVSGVTAANSAIQSLAVAEPEQLPLCIDRLANLKRWSASRLNTLLETTTDNTARRNAQLAIGVLGFANDKVDLNKDLLYASPETLLAIRDTHKRLKGINEPLWKIATLNSTPQATALRAAAVLANTDSKNLNWNEFGPTVAQMVCSESPSEIRLWAMLFEPVKKQLEPALMELFLRGNDQPQVAIEFMRGPKVNAAQMLALHWQESRDKIREWMFAASGEQLSAFLPHLTSTDQPMIDAFRKEIALPKSEHDELYQFHEANKPEVPEPDKANQAVVDLANKVLKDWQAMRKSFTERRIEFGRRRTRAAAALLHMRDQASFDVVVGDILDPTGRSELYAILPSTQLNPRLIAEPILKTKTLADKMALPWESLFGRILCLGRYTQANYDTNLDQHLVPHLRELFRHHPQSGIHSVCDWILRKMPDRTSTSIGALNDQTMANNPKLTNLEFIKQAEKELIAEFAPNPNQPAKPKPNFNWYIERTGQLMICFQGQSRPFAIAAKLTSGIEMGNFRKEKGLESKHASNGPNAANFITYPEMLGFCQSLSEKNGVLPNDFVFEGGGKLFEKDCPKPPPDFLTRKGFRLPILTEPKLSSEPVIASRAESVTRASFGENPAVATLFAVCNGMQFQPSGNLPPNSRGVFDSHGHLLLPTIRPDLTNGRVANVDFTNGTWQSSTEAMRHDLFVIHPQAKGYGFPIQYGLRIARFVD